MNTIGVLVRHDVGEAGSALRDLVAWLRDRRLAVVLEGRTAAQVGDLRPDVERVAGARQVAASADALVVLGGDGTLLAAAHAVERPIPVLGVNFGSLGFLTEIALPELYRALEAVLEGRHRCEERRMLRATVERGGTVEAAADVLNDVVVSRSAISRLVQLDVSVDGVFVSAFRADGILVSSPTGSTAYNLAAGGPILHPRLGAVVVTSICPHMLTNRPLVVSDEARIQISLASEREVDAQVTFDGQQGLALRAGDVVTVTRSPRTLQLVMAPERDYYEVLRTKLKWGEPRRR